MARRRNEDDQYTVIHKDCFYEEEKTVGNVDQGRFTVQKWSKYCRRAAFCRDIQERNL